METPYLDKEIEMYEHHEKINNLSRQGKEYLKEFRMIKLRLKDKKI